MEKGPGNSNNEGGKFRKLIQAATVLGSTLAATPALPEQAPAQKAAVHKTEKASASMPVAEFSKWREKIAYEVGSNTEVALADFDKKISQLSKAQRVDVVKMLHDQNISFNVALLTPTFEALYSTLTKDLSLVDVHKVNRNWVKPLTSNSTMTPERWGVYHKWLEEQNKQSMFAKLELLTDLSNRYGGVDPVKIEHAAAMVARNVHAMDLPVNDESVKKSISRTLEERENIKDKKLYDRNILLVSHSELWDDGPRVNMPRFGTKEYVDQLQAVQKEQAAGKPVRFTHATPLTLEKGKWVSTKESHLKAKEKTLKVLTTDLEPLNVIWNVHGLENELGLGDGVSVTVDDMAKALVTRYKAQRKKDPNVSKSDVILVIGACYGQNFLRNLQYQLDKALVPMPELSIVSSEFGQYGYSNQGVPVGSIFNYTLIHSRTVGDFIKNKESLPQDATPSVFVPVYGRLMQLGGIVIPSATAAA